MRSLAIAVCAALAALVSGPAQCGPTWHSFGDNRVEVLLPEGFTGRVDDSGRLVTRFGPDGSSVVELKLKQFGEVGANDDSAERYLRGYAIERKLPLKRERDRLMLIEPDSDFREGGILHRRTHWKVAFGQALVVLTLTAPMGKEYAGSVLGFLRGPLNEMLDSLRLLTRPSQS